MSRYFTPALAGLVPYTPGEQPRNRQYIKLNTNENPYPPSPAVLAAVAGAVPGLRRYSDPESSRLTAAAAAPNRLQPENILCGNGSDENLMLAIRAFCDSAHPLAFADITYGFYPVWCDLFGVPKHILPLRADYTIDPAAYCGLNETIVIANPNAPTGLLLPPAEIERIVRANPGSVVIVDEAYIDFGGESCLPLLGSCDNLLIVRTFSKSRSMAGARLGLCLGPAALIEDLKRVKYSMNPYNINSLTEAAGIAALADTAYFEKTCADLAATRADAAKTLAGMGFALTASAANFLFAETPHMPGGALCRALREKGVLVRHFALPRIENRLRISIGSPAEMQGLYAALREILG